MYCRKVAVLTTLFPINAEYVGSFFSSLARQTYVDFDVVIVNDDFGSLSMLKEQFRGLNFIELKASSSHVKNREVGINYLIENSYEIAIFADCDDYFSENRISVSVEKLNDCDIVVNDLVVFTDKLVVKENFLSARFYNNQVIEKKEIYDKNFFGLSNTSIRLKEIEKFDFPSKLQVLDWYLFTILMNRGARAVFTNEALTFYRQHEGNFIGIADLTIEQLVRGCEIKELQYSLLMDEFDVFEPRYRVFHKLKNDIDGEQYRLNLFKKINENRIENPLWWEEVRPLEQLDENKVN